MSEKIQDFIPAHLRSLPVYQPGKPVAELERELGISGAVKMASNENPMGPSPRALAAAERALATLHIYPDANAHYLRLALAERLGVDPSLLIFGNGMNELLYLLVQAFCEPGRSRVLSHAHAFISYRLSALAIGAHFDETPLGADMRCDVDALISKIGPETRIIFVGNPNNPTGRHWTRGELERLLEAAPSSALVVVDEAYHEYAVGRDGYSPSQPYQRSRDNLVTLRTFSKIYGLAGLRVGYGICPRPVADMVNRLRRPFNVNAVAQAAATAALDDSAHVARSVEAAVSGTALLGAELGALGLGVYPSVTNFVLASLGDRDEAETTDALLRRGVIVRPMGGVWGLPGHLRISVGTPDEMTRVVQTLRAVLG